MPNIFIKPETLAFKNNNPGNLRFAKQTGAEPGEGGFARFPSPQEGYSALVRQVELDAGRGHNFETFINKYAPPQENDTGGYLKFITDELGVEPDTLMSDISAENIARAIAWKESNTKITDTQQEQIDKMLKVYGGSL